MTQMLEMPQIMLDAPSMAASVPMALDYVSGRDWQMIHGDSCPVTKGLPDNSMDFTIHSPPFSNLYIYSDSIADMGNSADDREFFKHYLYLIREMHRITVPGRLCAVHCKDLPLYRNRDGAAGLADFPGRIIRAFERAGWVYHSKVTIWKDPVTEMERTKNHGLLYKNFRTISEVVRQGMPDYLLVFRKWEGLTQNTVSDKPVLHSGDVAMEYIGTDLPDYSRAKNPYERNLLVWQKYASPVWFDIDQTRVLNYRLGKGGGDEKHICPLQLGVIERAIQIWTNPGDVVFSPFAGIGSEPYSAVKLGRKGIGIELKQSYYQQAVKNMRQIELLSSQTEMFADADLG